MPFSCVSGNGSLGITAVAESTLMDVIQSNGKDEVNNPLHTAWI